MGEKIKVRASYTATIVEWREAQGFGFLELGNARVFLHRREFDEWHKAPEVGDRIRFSIGLDREGRTCAKSAAHLNDGGKFLIRDFGILAVLLILPCVALSRVAVPPAFSFGYFGMVSLFGYVIYAADKNRARRGEWRVPEQALHVVELLGGWPAAFVDNGGCVSSAARRVVRLAHKLVALGFRSG